MLRTELARVPLRETYKNAPVPPGIEKRCSRTWEATCHLAIMESFQVSLETFSPGPEKAPTPCALPEITTGNLGSH